MRILELFSGTHSIGKAAKSRGYEVVSLDRDLGGECILGSGYKSDTHIKKDIMDWDFTEYPPNHFDLITASPVCLWWSKLRQTWIGRKCKSIHPTDIITQEHLDRDIEKYGVPMVDKVFEIINYFQPKHWWIENPKTGFMKRYIAAAYPEYNTYYDIDYCKYSDWGYQKPTRFWTNMKDFTPKTCKKDCENMIEINGRKVHKIKMGMENTTKERKEKIEKENIDKPNYNSKRYERYRIPEKLINEFFENISR